MKKLILKFYLLISLLLPTALIAEGNILLTIDQAKLTQTTSKSTRFKAFCLHRLKTIGCGIKNFAIEITKQELLRRTNSSIQRITARRLIGPENCRFINLIPEIDATTSINDLIKKKLPYSLQSKINIDLQSLVKTGKHLEILKKIAYDWALETLPNQAEAIKQIAGKNSEEFSTNLINFLRDETLLNSFCKYLETHKNELNTEFIKEIPRRKGITTILSGPIATSIVHTACKIGQEAYNKSRMTNLSRTDSLINAVKAKKNITTVFKNPDLPIQMLEQILPTSEDSCSGTIWKILFKNHSPEEVNCSIRTISFGSSLGSFIADIYSGNILSSCFSGIETILAGLMIKEKLFNFKTASLKPHLNIIKLIKNYLHTKNIGLLIPLFQQVRILLG